MIPALFVPVLNTFEVEGSMNGVNGTRIGIGGEEAEDDDDVVVVTVVAVVVVDDIVVNDVDLVGDVG